MISNNYQYGQNNLLMSPHLTKNVNTENVSSNEFNYTNNKAIPNHHSHSNHDHGHSHSRNSHGHIYNN